MKNLLSVALISLALVAGSASAAPRFDYVEAGYTVSDAKMRSGDSWTIKASKEIGTKLFVLGNYTNGMDADFNSGVVGVGIGAHTPLATNVELYGQVEATSVVANRYESEKYGYRAESGVRVETGKDWTVTAGVRASNLREQSLDAVVWRGFAGVRYDLTDFVSVGVTASGKANEMDGQASVRLYF